MAKVLSLLLLAWLLFACQKLEVEENCPYPNSYTPIDENHFIFLNTQELRYQYTLAEEIDTLTFHLAGSHSSMVGNNYCNTFQERIVISFEDTLALAKLKLNYLAKAKDIEVELVINGLLINLSRSSYNYDPGTGYYDESKGVLIHRDSGLVLFKNGLELKLLP